MSVGCYEIMNHPRSLCCCLFYTGVRSSLSFRSSLGSRVSIMMVSIMTQSSNIHRTQFWDSDPRFSGFRIYITHWTQTEIGRTLSFTHLRWIQTKPQTTDYRSKDVCCRRTLLTPFTLKTPVSLPPWKRWSVPLKNEVVYSRKPRMTVPSLSRCREET